MWKRAGHIAFEARRLSDQQLTGFIIINRSALVVEFLARTIVEMKTVLQLTIQELHKNNISREGVRNEWIKFMQTRLIDNVLTDVTHDQVDFRFAAVHFLLSEDSSAKSEWLMWPDD